MIQKLVAPSGLRAIAIFVACGAGLYLAATVWAGFDTALASLQRIGLPAMLGGALLASLSYVLRFLRWRSLLRRFGHAIPDLHHFAVYVAGLALTPSPGKLGETLRSALLLPWGVTVEQSLAAFLVDRMSDVLGITMLGVIAARLAGQPLPILEYLLVGAWLSATLFRMLMLRLGESVWNWLSARGQRRPLQLLVRVVDAWAVLWRPSRVPVYALIAAAAYGVQALVFWGFARLAGIDISVASAISMFANATLFGAASMLPGGLGAMEAALVFQLDGATPGAGVSVSVAIATRIVTLWCGVLAGLIALLRVSGKPVRV
ncbi:lysylphosphatidylglycerol synthase transmembrane domain-containing protein [Uliginosibacterium sp. H3]|uniref:Lysylphosphatidylglycerol synthase transmembrane domain-containing protein n=1 Tax=Uliginosibacterium silvisoli TaxID=3114758 RepID=A0ABU6K0Y4_9RHOO|nr:lysylphosphatidylglycerol synthase transmembrane domain-containing protein [Uliginosibacterium sp. H3]